MLPGACIICGSSNDQRYFIDFGVNVKKYGRIYFCNLCFNECERAVYVAIDHTPSSNANEFRTDLLDDKGIDEVPKRKPGRPKRASN